MSPTYPHFRSPNGEPEGLCCKTKRGIGGGLLGKSKGVCQRIKGSILFVSQYNRMYPSMFNILKKNYLQESLQCSKVPQVLCADPSKMLLIQTCT